MLISLKKKKAQNLRKFSYETQERVKTSTKVEVMRKNLLEMAAPSQNQHLHLMKTKPQT